MFQEPFFLHPPGSRPRDGLYINPMNLPFEHTCHKDNTEIGGSQSFYLHSPDDLVYTRITHLFEKEDVNEQVNLTTLRSLSEEKDETLTVKVDVHFNNDSIPLNSGSGETSLRSEVVKDNSSEHAYEQIYFRHESQGSCKDAISNMKLADNVLHDSHSCKADCRYSRSSTTSEVSNISSEINCYSTTSTPSLSCNSSNERVTNSLKNPEIQTENKISACRSLMAENEKRSKIAIIGSNSLKPPPPPPPPPLEIELFRDERKDDGQTTLQEPNCEAAIAIAASNDTVNDKTFSTDADISTKCSVSSNVPATIKSICVDEVTNTSSCVLVATNTTTTSSCQVTAHLVNRHMVLPFIPPKFANHATDSDTLLKPSEYLRSICKPVESTHTSTLCKARSVDNLDIQCHTSEGKDRDNGRKVHEQSVNSGPPPPPLPPPSINDASNTFPVISMIESEPLIKQTQSQQQPLATISIRDLTSVQLRRTNVKMHAPSTFSVPPNRSVSMTNVSEAFFVQKTNLIAELKRTKDIPGIKKLKVQRAEVEKSEEKNLISEINKAFNISNFVEQIPEKDSSGNVIPIWKRQMLARKAADRAKKELEDQIARETAEKRQQSIPPWKRQLLAKKDSEIKNLELNSVQPNESQVFSPKIDLPSVTKKEFIADISTSPPVSNPLTPTPKLVQDLKITVVQSENNDPENVQIIPWRAQLRKTNSKLNILD